ATALRRRRAAAARVSVHLEGPMLPRLSRQQPGQPSPTDAPSPRPLVTRDPLSEGQPPEGPLSNDPPFHDPAPEEISLADLTPEAARVMASWDGGLDALPRELLRAREAVTEVLLPPSLTATELLRLAADPDGFARELARPMPRPPRPAARRGTRFHAWVET